MKPTFDEPAPLGWISVTRLVEEKDCLLGCREANQLACLRRRVTGDHVGSERIRRSVYSAECFV
jgi:hypothetical protein